MLNMVQYSCNCLNILVDLDDGASHSEFTLSSTAGDQVLAHEHFFDLEILCVQPKSAKVQIAQEWLVHRKQKCGWIFNTCINCGIISHCNAVPVENKMLINGSMQSDSQVIEEKKRDADFSPVYKLIIPGGQSLHDNEVTSIYLRSALSMQTIPKLDELANTFLTKEKAAMEERLKKFTEQEQVRMFNLEQKTQKEKHRLVQVLMSFQESDSELGILSDSVSGAGGLGQVHRMQKANNPSQYPLKSPQKPSVDSEDFDDSTLLFPMDPAEGESDKTSHRGRHARDFSDDDDEDDELNDNDVAAAAALDQFSTSVPINVPCMKNSNFKLPEALEESPTNPSDIGASIRALARSVHGDGSEIFGDLPRAPQPRVRRSDFTIGD